MNLTGKHLLTLMDYSKEEIIYLIDLSKQLKNSFKKNNSNNSLKGKSLGMIFQKRSTRTRVSTEVATTFLGGHALFLGKDDIQLGVNESLKDTAIVLSRFVDGILARVFEHSIVEELGKYSTVPVINALSDKFHPLQILADLMTIEEHYGGFENLHLVWIGDGNNVCHSLLVGCSKLGINMTVSTPLEYKPDGEIFNYAINEGKKSGANILYIQNPKEAVKDADIIVTDTFVSMGQEDEYKKRLHDFNGYQINHELVKNAKKDFKFMHCLPRHEYEVTDEIFYSDHSIVFDEAENRLHTTMAVLQALMSDLKRS